jgi:KDO2-lipid IV(A) lauroyltransferase
MSRASEQSNLWLPQHWPMWIGIGILGLASRWLAREEQRRVARVLGSFVFNILRLRRHVVLVNLRLCFPEKTEAEIHALARAHYDALAFGLFEVCTGWWARTEDLPVYRIVGLPHLEAAMARGRGALLLTAHFTTLEICGRLLAEAYGMGGLYRDPNNPVLAHVMRGQRKRHMTVAVHFDDLKGLIRALRAGYSIWYAPDQGKRTPGSEILPFFGEPAITNTATSKIAKMTGTAVVPFFGRREPDGSYTLTIHPALENFPTDDGTADAIRVNRLLEENIRLAPEQYFWVHKRFKARGPGYPEAY